MPVLIFLFLVAVLSVSPFSKKIENFLVTHKKIISRILMGISFLSVFLIFSNVPIGETGEMAIRLLWIILWIPIFAKVFNFGIAKKLMLFRKELGIRMGVLAFVHSTQYFLKPNPYMPWEQEFWFTDGGLSYIAWGAFASILVIAMTLTSNTFSLKNMGRYWKALHKTVYTVLLLSLLHVAFFQIQKQGHDFGTTLFLTLLPFGVYILGKMLEWNRIKIPVKMPAILIVSLIVFGTYFIAYADEGDYDDRQETPVETEKTTETSSPDDLTPETTQTTEPEGETPIESEPQIENTPIVSEIPEEEETQTEPELVVEEATANYLSIIDTCNSLCGSDSAGYCTQKQEVIFGDNKITYGTCRSLAKYNRSFQKCEGFCQQYGENKGTNSYCTLPDGTTDRTCGGG